MKLCDVYDAGQAMVKKDKPELHAKLTKNFGFAMGIEFREGSLLISPKTTVTAKKGEYASFLGLSRLIN